MNNKPFPLRNYKIKENFFSSYNRIFGSVMKESTKANCFFLQEQKSEEFLSKLTIQ